MNAQNLHRLIDKYEENFYKLNSGNPGEPDEIFKWKAAKTFRDVWFSEEAKTMSFSEKFNLAKKNFDILTDNSYVSPSNGIVKVAEKNQKAVETLFETLLFADDGGDLEARQNNIEKFLEEFDKLRAEHYPQSFKFKQERHSVSCYLAFFTPDVNFIYRFSDAEEFAKHVEYGKDLGSGGDFRLDRYYELCEIIVEALKEHPTLLEKHDNLIKERNATADEYYVDLTRHILAFDLMYCCRTYNFYAGMTHASKKDSIKAFVEAEAKEKERLEREARIAELEAELHTLEMEAEKYTYISLLNVEVNQATYGKGVVIAQQNNKVTVKFETCEKGFIINKKYPVRPTFENDTEIVEAFTEYDSLLEKIKVLKNKIALI